VQLDMSALGQLDQQLEGLRLSCRPAPQVCIRHQTAGNGRSPDTDSGSTPANRPAHAESHHADRNHTRQAPATTHAECQTQT
jgi:hypothetical protein